MGKSELLFLNTTNAPSLSAQSAKQMRGHITKSNFAKRRARIARSRTEETSTATHQDLCQGIITNRTATSISSQDAPSLFESSSFNACPRNDLQMLILLTCLRPARNPCEAAWFELFGSEPALIEATMAVGLRNWSPQPSWQWQAELHSQRALRIIIHKISSRNTHTDGFLGAVLTMAFAARQMHSNFAWDIHIDGLVQVISYRRSHGIDTPPWFYNILFMDSINHVFNFPQLYHRRVVDALDNEGCSTIQQIADITERLIVLRRSIDLYHKHNLDFNIVAEEIQQPLMTLQHKTHALRKFEDNLYLRAAVQTFEIILYLVWPSQSSPNLNRLAEDLKETICHLPHKACPYMDLTSCLLIVGAVAAGHGTCTRRWFVTRFTRAAQEMQSRGWENPLEILERGIRSDANLMAWFTMLCDDSA